MRLADADTSFCIPIIIGIIAVAFYEVSARRLGGSQVVGAKLLGLWQGARFHPRIRLFGVFAISTLLIALLMFMIPTSY